MAIWSKELKVLDLNIPVKSLGAVCRVTVSRSDHVLFTSKPPYIQMVTGLMRSHLVWYEFGLGVTFE